MNINRFEYTGYNHKVFFGENSFDLVQKILSSFNKAFVIAGKRHEHYVNSLKVALGQEHIVHFNSVVQHVPIELIEKANQKLLAEKTNVLVAIGGGSAIGLAKA